MTRRVRLREGGLGRGWNYHCLKRACRWGRWDGEAKRSSVRSRAGGGALWQLRRCPVFALPSVQCDAAQVCAYLSHEEGCSCRAQWKGSGAGKGATSAKMIALRCAGVLLLAYSFIQPVGALVCMYSTSSASVDDDPLLGRSGALTKRGCSVIQVKLRRAVFYKLSKTTQLRLFETIAYTLVAGSYGPKCHSAMGAPRAKDTHRGMLTEIHASIGRAGDYSSAVGPQDGTFIGRQAAVAKAELAATRPSFEFRAQNLAVLLLFDSLRTNFDLSLSSISLIVPQLLLGSSCSSLPSIRPARVAKRSLVAQRRRAFTDERDERSRPDGGSKGSSAVSPPASPTTAARHGSLSAREHGAAAAAAERQPLRFRRRIERSW